MATQVTICGRTVTLTYPNKSLRQLEEKVGYSILGKTDTSKTINVGELVTDSAAWLWAGSLKDDGGALVYEKVLEALDDMTLRELDQIKTKITEAFTAALPEKKDENPPTPASQQN